MASLAVQESHPQQHPDTRLSRASNTLKYVLDPAHGPKPSHLHTRAFLRSLRYFGIFVFWRVVRYAKYAAVGALVAAVGTTAIGSVVSGAAFIVAPTGIIGGATVGLVWAIAKFGWRRARVRWDRKDGHAADPRADERADAGKGEDEMGQRRVRLNEVDPW